MTSFSLRLVIGGTLTCWGVEGGADMPRGRSFCKHSSSTNKALLLMINGNGDVVCVCVCVCVCVWAQSKINKGDVGNE